MLLAFYSCSTEQREIAAVRPLLAIVTDARQKERAMAPDVFSFTQNGYMCRAAQAIPLLFLFLCLSCGSKSQGPSQSGNGPLPKQQAVRPQARLAVVPGSSTKLPEAVPHHAVVTIPGAEYIFSVVPAPASDDLFVLAETKNDLYGGAYFLVQPNAPAQRIQEIMNGTNLLEPDAPVWSPDGATTYFTFDDDKYPPDPSARGLYAFDRASGKTTRILADSISGLAISPDGALLAFWDNTNGDQLTVYNVRTRQIVRSWPGQVHSADDLVLTDMAFTPDAKSVLARIYAQKDPLLQFDIATGKTSLFANNVQSVVSTGSSIYFMQFEPVPFTNPEHPHGLMKWAIGDPAPTRLIEDFPYLRLLPGGPRWLIAQSGTNGTAIDDMETGKIETAGASCDTAVVTSRGEVLYVYGGELVTDVAVCSGAPPKRDWSRPGE